jgi:nucleoside phosphorylase
MYSAPYFALAPSMAGQLPFRSRAGQRWCCGAVVLADRAIGHFNPDLVLFVGVGGGLKDVKLERDPT